MARPIIGWQQPAPVPDQTFNDYLSVRAGRLYYEDLDLAQLFVGGHQDQGLGRQLPSPLELVYLPKIRRKIEYLTRAFAETAAETHYPGRFYYAYASKANTAEEVVRTTLGAGAHHEMSSLVDVEIARLMHRRGDLPADRLVIANGFKPAGSDYAAELVRFKTDHDLLIPVVEDLAELPPLIESGLNFEVGLRLKSYGQHRSAAEMAAANSRFGLNLPDLEQAATLIESTPNLRLKLFHAMIGSQLIDGQKFVEGLKPAMELYARLRQQHPDLSLFNFGGGMPVGLTLDFSFDYRAFVRRLLTTLKTICDSYGIPAPDVMGEFGRYTTAEHGAHLFKVVLAKENDSALPWYIIDGSIMTSFPDSWALAEHFIVLPLTHLDKPFRRVQLGGITCDSDDVYPPKSSRSPLYLPVETKDLYLGFFGVGAYQEMLGGARGAKHCVLPEANELIVDRDEAGHYHFQLLPGQTAADVLRNLGYTTSDP